MGRKSIPTVAKKQSQFLMQAITVMLRKAANARISHIQRSVYGTTKRVLKGPTQAALELYFPSKEMGTTTAVQGRVWALWERGSIPDVDNDRIREFYTFAFLGERARVVNTPLMKSVLSARAATTSAIKQLRDDYSRTEDEIIRAIVTEFGINRIIDVARRRVSTRRTGKQLKIPRNSDDVDRTIQLIAAIYDSRIRTGKSVDLSAEKMEDLIKKQPALRCAYRGILLRMHESIGPDLDKMQDGNSAEVATKSSAS